MTEGMESYFNPNDTFPGLESDNLLVILLNVLMCFLIIDTGFPWTFDYSLHPIILSEQKVTKATHIRSNLVSLTLIQSESININNL